MSEEIKSIDDLRKTAAMEEEVEETETEETEVEETENEEENNTIVNKKNKFMISEDDLIKSAIEKENEEKLKEEQRAIEAKNLERKADGREYEYEVEGFNIGDAIMRRAHTIDNNGSALSEQLAEERLEEEINSKEDVDDQINDVDNFDDDLSDSIDTDYSEDDLDKDDKKNKEENIDNNTLPSQEELDIDDEDLDDIDLDEEDDDEFDDEDDELSEQEIADLREAIKDKLKLDIPVNTSGEAKISANKTISLNDVLSMQTSNANVIDYPLMSAGRCVSMREFSGTEIESLNQGASGRNRFNTLKTIYHTLYDHIVDNNKPEFDKWLKVTSFMDIEHLYMAAYKASFNGANYIPFNCTNDKCNHVFLSDNIEIEDMIKFKDDAAKKKFYDILENSDTISKEDACLYKTKIVPVSPTIAIGFREPSIYNTIFENSVLDQNFINKYTRLLTMMVYIDNIYVIQNGEYVPVRCRVDRHSLAKTAKIRIVTYSKIIRTLPSDSYNNILAEIAKINDLGDEVKYQLPEITCPKCGQTIEATEQTPTQLLFSRHQLNLLSQES